jgi:type III pantothenate kinase
LNLVIDIGNTRSKAALFKDHQILEIRFYESFSDILKDDLYIKLSKKAIIGSVVEDAESLQNKLQAIVPTLLFTSSTKTPLKNAYQSAATLGSDRLTASVGAYSLYPDNNVLVIDCGTCIKYNFTTKNNEYLGGAISPGIQMRFKALQHFTSKLPLIEADFAYKALIGNTTQNSILSGVINGSIAEIDGIINEYKQQFPDLICVLTGGDSEHLAKRLKNSIFVHQNLVLKGLNDILNYNLKS